MYALHVRIMSIGAKWEANENSFMYEFRRRGSRENEKDAQKNVNKKEQDCT